MSYLLTLNIFDKTDKKNAKKPKWIQFRLDKGCNKITYYRTILVPQNCVDVTWLEYDSIRDCLIGYNSMDEDKQEYIISYLPDISKMLDHQKLPKLSEIELDQAKLIDKMANPLRTPVSAAKIISTKNEEEKSIWEQDAQFQEEMKQQQAADMIDAVLGALSTKKSDNKNVKRNSKKNINNNNDKVVLQKAEDPFKINVKAKQAKKLDSKSNVDKTPTIKPSNSLRNRKKGQKSPRKGSSNNKDTPMLKMLKEIKCEEYYDKLVDDGFETLTDLREATEEDLAEVGVKPSHINKIIKKLRK